MKKFLILIMFISIQLLAVEYQSPMSIYKSNYFIAGNETDQVKIQLSTKFNIFYPSYSGLFLGYTQLSTWICYEKRDTFFTMYSPEIFYNFESGKNIFNNLIIPGVDYIQVSPINHSSTGAEGESHRGVNTYYGQIQLSLGELVNIGVNGKYFRYYSMSNYNRDINDYKKNYEASIFFKIKSKTVEYLDKEEIHFKIGGNPKGKGYYCIEAQFRIITSAIQPKLFIQYYKGYDEFLINYNKKTNSIRIGLIF